MKKLSFYVALFAAKCAQLAMQVLGRNATYLPGKIAVRLCKDFLGHLTPPKTVIAVTGTNGKTTVSNLVASILKENGYSIINNSFGSNVQAGVISALIADSTFGGKPKKDIAVLEVDERSSLLIYPYLKPNFLICNNLMRDSMKRNAHTEFIQYIINKALPENTTLILNADDLIASGLGTKTQKKIFFGIEAEKPEVSKAQHITDIVYCPECGHVLEHEYVRYNHIGRHYCPNCSLTSPKPDFVVTDIDRENQTFTISAEGNAHVYTLINDNIVNVYNFASAIALLTTLGLNTEQISKGFSQSKIVKTRLDEVKVNELSITMLMAKGQNPIACSRCIDYVSVSNAENKGVIIAIDDRDDNTNNSENMAWIYDCDYAALKDPRIKQIVFYGPRCKDHYLRSLLAGIDESKIQLTTDVNEAPKLLDTALCKNIFVLHDLYRVADASTIKNALMAIGKGETI